MLARLSILLAIVAFASSNEIDAGDNNFKDLINTHDAALVMFYAPWCGHCKRMKPEFAAAAIELSQSDPPVQLIKVDCTEEGKDTCSQFGVSGYPTLKIFKDGKVASDYNGPRQKDGIIKFMKAQVGPVSKELKTVADAEAFLGKQEAAVVFFGSESSLHKSFVAAADALRESVRFAHSSAAAVLEKYGAEADSIVLFRAPQMKNKFEPASVTYEGAEDKKEIKSFVKSNFHGLVGHRTQDTSGDFHNPLVLAYYSVDYAKNPKGTNYWRNRVLKVAQNFAGDYSFAVADHNDFMNELEEFGVTYTAGDKPVVCARDADGQKFVMKEEFSMDALTAFLTALKAGELEAHIKSEPIPESQGNVIVGVGKNMKEVITDSGRDALVEFYAPWCGHCKSLAPVYEELGDKLADEDVDIIKVDATANDVPPAFNVRGFPTLYWKPKSGSPVQYQGGRTLDDFVKYIAKHATEELKGFSRDGTAKKVEL